MCRKTQTVWSGCNRASGSDGRSVAAVTRQWHHIDALTRILQHDCCSCPSCGSMTAADKAAPASLVRGTGSRPRDFRWDHGHVHGLAVSRPEKEAIHLRGITSTLSQSALISPQRVLEAMKGSVSRLSVFTMLAICIGVKSAYSMAYRAVCTLHNTPSRR